MFRTSARARLVGAVAKRFGLSRDLAEGLVGAAYRQRWYVPVFCALGGCAVFFGWMALFAQVVEPVHEYLREQLSDALAIILLVLMGYATGIALGVTFARLLQRTLMLRYLDARLASGACVCRSCLYPLAELPVIHGFRQCPECGHRTAPE